MFDTSPKARIPAFTDRILWKTREQNAVRPITYKSHPDIFSSDHKVDKKREFLRQWNISAGFFAPIGHCRKAERNRIPENLPRSYFLAGPTWKRTYPPSLGVLKKDRLWQNPLPPAISAKHSAPKYWQKSGSISNYRFENFFSGPGGLSCLHERHRTQHFAKSSKQMPTGVTLMAKKFPHLKLRNEQFAHLISRNWQFTHLFFRN